MKRLLLLSLALFYLLAFSGCMPPPPDDYYRHDVHVHHDVNVNRNVNRNVHRNVHRDVHHHRVDHNAHPHRRP